MCERPPFRRWLVQGLVGAIRAVPGLIGGIIGGIRSPLFEMIVGITGVFASSILSLIVLGVSFYTRVAIALCVIPSVVILLHGIYRENDC